MSQKGDANDDSPSPASNGAWLRIVVGVAIALALLTVGGVFAFGSVLGPNETVPLAQLAWFLPTAQSFLILAGLAIAGRCLGRYRALGGAWVLWTGMAFLANAVLGVFYLLAWPGLLGTTGVIAKQPNTSSALFILTYGCIALLAWAVGARRPERLNPLRVLGLYALAAVIAALIGLMSALYEADLPILLVGGVYTPLSMALSGALIVAWAASSVLACLRYRAERDEMLGYVALFLTLMAFGLLDGVAGGKRYDVWWYGSRLAYSSAYLVLLFGFLQEGYLMFSRERERAEERARLLDQLEYQRARWQATVDNMLDLVTVCDATGRVTYINPAYTALVGRLVEPGLPLEEHPKYYQIFRSDGTLFAVEDLPLQRATLRDEEVRAVEIVHRATDGREITCVFNAAPLHDESGRVIGAVAVGHDITQQRRAEADRERLLRQVEQLAETAQRRATELDVANKELDAANKELDAANKELDAANKELDAANKELQAFSYSVSHDLRAPLRHIDGFGRILLRDYSDKLDEQGKHYLQVLREGSQRMEQLIDAMLKLSRVTRAEMRRRPVDMSELAASILAELHKEQPERQVELTVAPNVIANGDPALLRIVLENLLGNAWKFTSKRPVTKIEFGVTPEDDKPVYHVKDNGAGFDMAYVERLFSAFQRLHKAEEFPGTGIGLATVQRIIHRHGGRVGAEGGVDGGATFFFTLDSK